jgi:hypothetical protein
MSTPNDQPRPDLDAAIDAVVPSLTAVSDDAAARSLRRSRVALADDWPVGAAIGAWRWAVPVVAMTVAVLVVLLRLSWSPVEEPRVANVGRPEAPASARPPTVPPPAPAPAAPQGTPGRPERVASAEPAAPQPDRRRGRAVRATSVPADAPRPDPLALLVRAVGTISEKTWTEVLARAEAPLAVPDVSLAPIVVAPFETPAIAETPADPVAPGEP